MCATESIPNTITLPIIYIYIYIYIYNGKFHIAISRSVAIDNIKYLSLSIRLILDEPFGGL